MYQAFRKWSACIDGRDGSAAQAPEPCDVWDRDRADGELQAPWGWGFGNIKDQTRGGDGLGPWFQIVEQHSEKIGSMDAKLDLMGGGVGGGGEEGLGVEEEEGQMSRVP